MAQDIIMPRLSDSMEEGTILKWLKSVGDDVKVGEELVEIETDKANMVYEADVEGTVIEILLDEGGSDDVGAVIARVGGADEKPQGKADVGKAGGESAPAEAEAEEAPVADEAEAEAPAEESGSAEATEEAPAEAASAPAASENGGRVKASPLARRVAADQGVDVASLSGSGPGGRIIKNDVEAAAKSGGAPAAAPAAAPKSAAKAAAPGETGKGSAETVELSKLQQVIARRMSESKAVVPHFYLQTEIDMSAAVEGRKRLKAAAGEGEVVPSFNDMVLKATALALRQFPVANGIYKDDKFELYSRINIGVAVAAQGALVVPTVFDTDLKGLAEISTDVKTLAKKVRDGSITPPELSGSTFTVSNLGMYGITNFQAIVNMPHAAILAVGAITETPVVRNGEITTAHMMGVTLSCDHRILYGADAAEFLGYIRKLLEEPLSLAL